MLRQCGIFLFFTALSLVTLAAPVIPKESKVLGMTKGKAFEDGLVFIDGKYIAPPYVVERWGVGIRINGKPVVGQVVEWSEFLKTQSGFKVIRPEVPAGQAAETKAEPEPEKAPEPEPAKTADASDDDAALDDLFDDAPKPKKATTPAKPAVVKAPPKPKKPALPPPTYAIEGEFKPNEATKAMVERIKAVRTEIEAALRKGGFMCFSDRYSRVTGDQRTALQLLEKIPSLQRNCTDEREFISAIHQARIAYLNEWLCQDLFRNRIDYRKLQERREKWKKDLEFKKVLDGASSPLF